MMANPESHAIDDGDRLAALRHTGLLDTPPEASFDRLTRLAARLLKVPASLVSLVDADRQFFKSCIGLPEPWSSERQTPLSHSFCQHAVMSGEPFIVEDARSDPRVAGNRAIDDLGVIAYAGIPLVTSDGQVLGSFCVIDTEPRHWTDDEIETLSDLATSVMTEIELRREILERQSVENALRSGESQVRALLDSLFTFVAVTTTDGTLLEVNRPALEAAGLQPEDVLGKPFEETYWWSYDTRVQEQLRNAIRRAAEGEPTRYDVSVRIGDESYLTIDFMLAPLRDEQGQVIRLIPSAIDITDRRRNEDERARLLRNANESQRLAEGATLALERERDRLRQVLDEIPEGILIAEGDQRFSLCNAAGAQILGVDLTHHRALSSEIGAFQPRRPDGTPVPLEQTPTTRALMNGDTVRGERLVVRKQDTGEDISILVSSAPLRDPDGTVTGAVTIFQDISSISSDEQQKDDFLATVSHDLRSPITAIRGHAQMLQRVVGRVDHPSAPRLIDGLERIDASTRHMVQLLDDLVDLAYLSMNRGADLRLQPTDLTAMTRDAVADYQDRTEYHDLRLEISGETLGLVDPPRIRRVLDNLLSNAIKYSPDGGEVEVVLRQEQRDGEPWATLYVRDQGVGIPAEDLPRIFDRYSRGANVGGIKGTGLGLAGAHHIVTQHGGTIEIESELGKGTAVTVHLPLSRLDDSQGLAVGD